MTAASQVHDVADAFRVVFFVAAGLYLGVAVAVLRRYFEVPPQSRLRRAHVIGVSVGTTLLVLGMTGGTVERLGDPVTWYGFPVGFAGIVIITMALASLFVAEGHPRPDGHRATDHALCEKREGKCGSR
ncbi:MAG TPA: hypothetical protein VFF69_03810 [Phycisphaerales bacterium]|nr:hypothetical protein [Phycisphaerales bacterium]